MSSLNPLRAMSAAGSHPDGRGGGGAGLVSVWEPAERGPRPGDNLTQ